MRKILSIFLAFFAAQTLYGDIAWSAPETLSSELVQASEPQVVIDQEGNSTVLWVENGAIITKTQPFNGSWSVPEVLAVSAADAPQIAIDGQGKATAVWIQLGTVQCATKPKGGSWSMPSVLSGLGASNPDIAVNPQGDAAAIWVRNGFIEAATKPAGELGMWSLVSVLSGSSSDNPAIAIGEERLVCAVWHSVVTGNDAIQSATQQIGGAWSSVKTLLTGSAYKLNYPSVAVNSNGTAVATWYRYTKTGSNYTNVYLLSSNFTGSSWSVPIPISNVGNRNPADLFNHLHMDSSGNTIAFWTQSYDSSNFDIETAIRPFGRAWAESAPLTTGNETAFKGDIATTSLKNAVAAYMLLDGGETVIQAVESGISGVNDGTTFWTAPFRLSADGRNGYPRVACAYNSNTSTLYSVAVWLNFNGILNVVNGSVGRRTVLPPPFNLSVTQGVNDFGLFTTYSNQIEWDPSPSGDVQQYAIYRNGIFLQTVDAGTNVYVDNNAQQNGTVTYGVSAVDAGFLESPVVNVNFP